VVLLGGGEDETAFGLVAVASAGEYRDVGVAMVVVVGISAVPVGISAVAAAAVNLPVIHIESA